MTSKLGHRTGLCIGGNADGEFRVSQYEHHLTVVQHHLDPEIRNIPIKRHVHDEVVMDIKRTESHYDRHIFQTQHGEFHLWVHDGMTLEGALTKVLNGYAVLKQREKEERHGR